MPLSKFNDQVNPLYHGSPFSINIIHKSQQFIVPAYFAKDHYIFWVVYHQMCMMSMEEALTVFTWISPLKHTYTIM